MNAIDLRPIETYNPAQDTVAFVNDGLIDPLAIATFGVNAKVTDNPIGYFGTGLKYAIAVLLRHGHEITIWRGTERLDFDLVEHESRGKTFSIVRMNGSPLGFTTDLGKNWEMWQALRELWCNCADENGEAFAELDYTPADEKTAVIVKGAEFSKAFAARGDFILDTQPTHVLSGIEIHPGQSQTIFYRGIAVARLPDNKVAQHTYNITGEILLTEDRTVKYTHQIEERIAQAYQRSENIKLIEDAVCAPEGSLERQMDYTFHETKPSSSFIETVMRIARTREVNKSAQYIAEKNTPLPALQEYRPSERELDDYATATTFLLLLGYEIEAYPVRFFESLSNDAMGTSTDGEISISRAAFDAGTKRLTITLLREFLNCNSKSDDQFSYPQERLLNDLVSLGEEHVLRRAL